MENIEIESIWEHLEGKKKINSGTKGKGGERELVHLLNERFSLILSQNPNWGKFSRSVGSGNRFSQANLSLSATKVFSGDLICENFKFVIESKAGYDIDLNTLFSKKGNKEIDSFLSQVSKDSERSKKRPLLIWKKDRKPRLAFLKEDLSNFDCFMRYKGWSIVALDELLTKKQDEFFFDTKG